MALISRVVDIPLFLYIEKDILPKIPDILSENQLNFDSILVLSGTRTYEVAGKMVYYNLIEAGKKVEKFIVRDSTTGTVNDVKKIAKKGKYNLIIGVGGGKVIDVGKYVGAQEEINFISVPTTAANDGISSPVSVIIKGNRKNSIITKMPLGVIADLNIIRNAPERTIRAGIGDLLSNISAVQDWELARDIRNDSFDEFAVLLSSRAAESVLNSNLIDEKSVEFIKVLVGSLILSGISMGIAGSSKPCSGAEHKFSHALDAITNSRALHGEQTAVGLIISTYMRGGDWEKLIEQYKIWKLPVCASDLHISGDTLVEAILYAKKIRPERYTILEHIDVDRETALKAAKNTGTFN